MMPFDHVSFAVTAATLVDLGNKFKELLLAGWHFVILFYDLPVTLVENGCFFILAFLIVYLVILVLYVQVSFLRQYLLSFLSAYLGCELLSLCSELLPSVLHYYTIDY
jgi:hypothetical protein